MGSRLSQKRASQAQFRSQPIFCARRENSLGTRLGHAVYLNVALVLRHFVWPRIITYHKNGKNKNNTQKQANPTSSHLSLHLNFGSARSRPRWSRDLQRWSLTFWTQRPSIRTHLCSSAHSKDNVIWLQQWTGWQDCWSIHFVPPSGLISH